MGKLVISIDTAAAIRLGRMASGRSTLEVGDEQVAALTEEQRELLAYAVDNSDPPVLRALQDNGDGLVYRGGQNPYPPAQLAEPTWAGVVAYLDECLAARAQAKAQAEQYKADEVARVRDRHERSVAKIVEGGVAYLVGAADNSYKLTGLCLPCATDAVLAVLEDPRCAGLVAEARAELARLKAEAERREAEAVAKRERAQAEAQAEREQWVAEHGSERLRRLLAEQIEHSAVYRDERLALERPGWRWEWDVRGEGEAPRNATAEALALLDEARGTLPEAERDGAQLRHWIIECDCADYYDNEDDGDGHSPRCGRWRGYVVVAKFLDCREIVFGGPGRED